ncbi:MAG TPA: hypothetical protein ENI73_05140 [Spirochaetes bacterium]|nr:hypothetical protein [Spirochaetota bacterium]
MKKDAGSLGHRSDTSKKMDGESLLDLLWGGNGLVKNEGARTFTHPVNFTTLIDLYILNTQGVFHYNFKKNKLKKIKSGNVLSKLKVTRKLRYKANTYILISLSPSMKRVVKAIRKKIKNVSEENLGKIIKDYKDRRQNEINESALIEAGTAAKNIMLLASAYNMIHTPLSLKQDRSTIRSIKKQLGIKKKRNKPFILIPLGVHKKGSKSGDYISYIQGLFKQGKNSRPGDFDFKSALKYDQLIKLLWVANGAIKSKGISSHPSGFPNSFIELYYVNEKKIQSYDPRTNSLKTIKFGDFRKRIMGKNRINKIKIRNAIIIARKSNTKDIRKQKRLFRGRHSKKIIKYYKRLIKNQKSLNALSLFQVGVALQTIRLLATDYDLAYQYFIVPRSKRSRLAQDLFLKKGDRPIFIIPIGKKDSAGKGSKKNT